MSDSLRIISIFIITFVGFAANRKGILPNQSSRYLVDLLMMITTPCMVLASITSTELTEDTVKTQYCDSVAIDKFNYEKEETV